MKDVVVYGSRLPFPIKYAFVPSQKALDKELKKLDIIDPDTNLNGNSGLCITYTIKGKDPIVFIYVDVEKSPEPVCTIGLVVHECMHLYQTMIETMQEEKPSCEFEAYMMQHLTQEILWIMEDLNLLKFPPKKKRKKDVRSKRNS